MTSPGIKTSKGYKLAWLNKCTCSVQGFEGYSGRVRLVADDPSQDAVVRWDSNNQPINHDYGQLVREQGVRSESVNGFNLFSGLTSSQTTVK